MRSRGVGFLLVNLAVVLLVHRSHVRADWPVRPVSFRELRVGLFEYLAAKASGYVDWLAGPLACQTWKHPVSA